MDLSCLVTTAQAGGGGVMVWGMFSWHTLYLYSNSILLGNPISISCGQLRLQIILR